MKKNLKGIVEAIEQSEAQCLVDMNQYDMIGCSGMFPDTRHAKSAHMCAGWRFSDTARAVIPMGGSDLSAFRYLTFSVFAVNGEGGTFQLMFDNSESGNGQNGYECILPIERNGWNRYRLEIPFLHALHAPTGWNQIGSICFDCVAGGQTNREDTVLYIDNLFVWENSVAPLYAGMQELKGAAAFSLNGNYAIVDRKRVCNTPDGANAAPFERDGVLWVPMAPVAAGIAHSAVVDNHAFSLTFTYRRKKYAFSAASDKMTVDGNEESIGFYPAIKGGTLLFPATFVRDFFHWRQIFTDPTGVIILSNRKNVFDSSRDADTLRRLALDLTFVRPGGDTVLNDLHRRFPNPLRGKLLLSYDELIQLRKDLKTDGGKKEYYLALRERFSPRSPAFLEAPISAEGQENLADALRSSSEKLIAFSLLYRLSGDKQYCERAAAEAEALAKFTDWNSAAIAVMGETAFAVALCYDWCHHAWSEARKAVVERALLRNAMRVGLETYDGKRKMWVSGGSTAALVNTGMLACALALSDVYPETSFRLLNRILPNMEPCFAAYSPDGGYAEGCAAWEKTTRALTLSIAMLEKACGTDYGLFSAPGFARTAYFPIFAETKNGAWNYHNCAAVSLNTDCLNYFSRRTGDTVPAWMRRRQILTGVQKVQPMDLFFYCATDDSVNPHLPLDAAFRNAGLAMMRSDWGENASFAGLHGGSNRVWNGDLDAGSFLLEMGGERFFAETGGREELPVILRRRAEGQNTISIGAAESPAPDQNPGATAPLTEMRIGEDRAFAAVDLSAVSDLALRAKRGVLMTDGRKTVVIQDEIVVTEPTELTWSAWTPAEVVLRRGGKEARLTLNEKTLICRLSGAPMGARLETETVEGCDLTRLVLRTGIKERIRLSFACRLEEDCADPSEKFYEPVPMSTWAEE